MATPKRLTLDLDVALWQRTRQAAGRVGALEGRPVPTAELIRRVLTGWLDDTRDGQDVVITE